MTNNRRTKSFLKIFFSQFSVALLVTVMALSILFYAQGYRFNIKNFKITKTGVLFVSTYPKDATVYLDDEKLNKKTPISLNLAPSYYFVEVKKDGYKEWSTYLKIEEGIVDSFKSVVLIKSDIVIEKLTDQRLINLVNAPIDTLANKNNNGLAYSDYEIWSGDQLITRFSEPILKAYWYSDKDHILYQQGNEIRIIEKTGTNDTLLVTLEQDYATSFVCNDKGDELYFYDNGEYKKATIR